MEQTENTEQPQIKEKKKRHYSEEQKVLMRQRLEQVRGLRWTKPVSTPVEIGEEPKAEEKPIEKPIEKPAEPAEKPKPVPQPSQDEDTDSDEYYEQVAKKLKAKPMEISQKKKPYAKLVFYDKPPKGMTFKIKDKKYKKKQDTSESDSDSYSDGSYKQPTKQISAVPNKKQPVYDDDSDSDEYGFFS